jgi:hypothetical protein
MGGQMSFTSGSTPKGGLGALLSMLNPPVQKVFKMEYLKPELNPDAKKIRITYGPYKIRSSTDTQNPGNSYSMDPHGSGYAFVAGDDFPRDVTVLATQSMLVNETFEKAIISDGLYNHHNTFYDSNKTPEVWLACGDKPQSSVPVTVLMGGATEDSNTRYTSADGKFKSGFYIGKNDRITIQLDVVNYQPRERTVYTVSEMEYLPGKPSGYVHTQSHVLRLGMCDPGVGEMATKIKAPPGQTKFTIAGKNEITIGKDGWLVQTSEY